MMMMMMKTNAFALITFDFVIFLSLFQSNYHEFSGEADQVQELENITLIF